MSLQGSLDAFALPDVLVLLSGTKKSGELTVSGRRTDVALDGRVWVSDGHLVGADVGRPADVVEAVFELLRLTDGTFSFGPGVPPVLSESLEVEPVLAEAQARLEEWREIEKVVPSQAAWLDLAPEPPGNKVVMTADQWRMIAQIGGGCTVGSALERLGRGELPGCRAVKELVETGLVRLGDAPATGSWGEATPGWGASWGEPVPAQAPPAEPESRGVTPEESPWSFAALATDEEPSPWPVGGDATDAPVAEVAAPAEAADWRAELGDAPDLDAFLTRDAGDSPTDPGTPGEDVDEDADEPLNRGLLLKFLSSVRN